MPPRQLSDGAQTRETVVFARPQRLPEDWYRTWEELVTSMRREAEALPMNTMMALLVERIATMYVTVRMLEAEQHQDWEQLRTMQALWLKFMTEFATQLHRHSQTPEQRFVASFKAGLNAALRKAGPDCTVRDFLPMLTEELLEFGI